MSLDKSDAQLQRRRTLPGHVGGGKRSASYSGMRDIKRTTARRLAAVCQRLSLPIRFLWFAHVLIGKPIPTFPGHALASTFHGNRMSDEPIAAIELHHVALPTRREHKWTGLTEPIGGHVLVRTTDAAGTVSW